MTTLLAQILPIFAVIGVGVVAGRVERFGERTAATLNDLVYYIALPALIFGSVVGADLSDGVPPGALVASVVVVAVVYALGAGVAALARYPAGEANAVGLVASWGNVGYLGIPLSVAVLGPTAAFPASLVSTLQTVLPVAVFLIASTVIGRRHAGDDAAPLPVLLARRVLGNPLVIAVSAGTLLAAVQLRLPAPVLQTIDLLGAMAAPGGLFALGILLRGAVRSLRTQRSGLVGITAGVVLKLAIMPAAAWVAVTLLAVPEPWRSVVLVMAALPNAATVFVLTWQYRTWYRESTAVVVITTALSVVSLPLVVALLL